MHTHSWQTVLLNLESWSSDGRAWMTKLLFFCALSPSLAWYCLCSWRKTRHLWRCAPAWECTHHMWETSTELKWSGPSRSTRRYPITYGSSVVLIRDLCHPPWSLLDQHRQRRRGSLWQRLIQSRHWEWIMTNRRRVFHERRIKGDWRSLLNRGECMNSHNFNDRGLALNECHFDHILWQEYINRLIIVVVVIKYVYQISQR